MHVEMIEGIKKLNYNIMKNLFLFFTLSFFFFAACDVDKTEKGESPELDVDVDADPGELPEYDVDWANVTVDTRTKTVTVPKVVIVQEEEQVEVPYVDISMPDKETVERTIMVEAQVASVMHNLNIMSVYAKDDELIVIANLQATDQSLEDRVVRVSDQLILNVPDDLDIEKYIIGERPTGEYNDQYEYIQSIDELDLDEAQQIYSS